MTTPVQRFQVDQTESRGFPRLLTVFWVLALALLIGFNLFAHAYLKERVKDLDQSFEAIRQVSEQKIAIQQARDISHAYVSTEDEALRATLLAQWKDTLTGIESKHNALLEQQERLAATDADPTISNVAVIYSSIPHNLDQRIRKYLDRKATIVSAAEAGASPGETAVLLDALDLPPMDASLDELIKAYWQQNRAFIQKTDLYGVWMLVGNLAILIFISLFIIFPLFRRVRRQIEKITITNEQLNDRREELEKSRLAAMSIMEDAQIARRAAEKGRDSAQRLAAFVSSSTDAIIGKTVDGTITAWNQGAEMMYGYTAQEAVGQSIRFIVPENKVEEFHDFMARLREGKKVDHFETQRRCKDGRVIDVSLSLSPIKNEAGELTGVAAIGRDVTEVKAARVALQEREKWFRSLIEYSSDVLLQLNLQAEIIYASPSVERVFGYSVGDVTGQSIYAFIHPDDVESITEALGQTVTAAGETVVSDCRVRHKDGSWRWVESTGQNLLAEESIRAIVVNCRDVTERKMATEAVLMEKERAQNYLDIAGVMMVVLNAQGEVTLINKKGCELLGYEREEDIVGRDWFACFVAQPRHVAREAFDRLMGDQIQTVEYTEYPIVSQTGKSHLIAWHNSLIRDSSGRPVGTLSSGEDITFRRQAEEQLQQYTADLRASNKELENFAFIASHDLQEPLRIVSSYVQLFAKRFQGDLDETSRKYVGYIVENSKRMQEMIHALLSYSRIGRTEEQGQALDCGRVCDWAIENCRFLIKKRKAVVTRGELPVVDGVETDFLQLFQNLISNAIKYCDRKVPEVSITSKKIDSEWLFCVEDNGIGIEKEYVDRVFEIFKRLHSKAEFSGTGIGLAICKKVVDRNGGRIWVESEPGKGSRFFFTLPERKVLAHAHKIG